MPLFSVVPRSLFRGWLSMGRSSVFLSAFVLVALFLPNLCDFLSVLFS